jgi:tetratricopeptide (TPR) repeat protein
MSRIEKLFIVRLLITWLLISLSLNAPSQLTTAQIDSLTKELAKAKEDTNKIKLLQELGNNVGYYDLNGALKYALEGFDLSKKINYPPGIGNMAYLSGITYMDLGDYPKSDSFLNIAEQKYQQLNDKFRLAKVANAKGSWSYMQGDYWGASDNYAKAAEGFDELKDSTLSLIAYQNLISVLGQINNHEKAATLGKKIIKIAESGKDTLQIGYTLQALCSDLVYLGKYDEALPYLKSLLIIAGNTIDNNLSAEAYSIAGTYYYKTADFENAVSFFEASIRKAETLDNKYQLANHYNSLGQSFLRQNNLAKAKEFLFKADQLAKEFNNTRASYNVALSLSEYFAETGDHKKSYENLKRHLVLKDSILNSETRNYSSYIETKYETNKKKFYGCSRCSSKKILHCEREIFTWALQQGF